MPAKAIDPVETLPGTYRFRGHGPLLKERWRTTDRGHGHAFCRSGPCPRKRSIRSKRFLARTAFAAIGRSYDSRRFGLARRGLHPARYALPIACDSCHTASA